MTSTTVPSKHLRTRVFISVTLALVFWSFASFASLVGKAEAQEACPSYFGLAPELMQKGGRWHLPEAPEAGYYQFVVVRRSGCEHISLLAVDKLHGTSAVELIQQDDGTLGFEGPGSLVKIVPGSFADGLALRMELWTVPAGDEPTQTVFLVHESDLRR